jgi:hypothetical protein
MVDAEQKRLRALEEAEALEASDFPQLDFDSIGRALVDAVGLPLVAGSTAKELGQEVSMRIAAAQYLTNEAMGKRDRKESLAARSIANQARNLAQSVEKYAATFDRKIGETSNILAGLGSSFQSVADQIDDTFKFHTEFAGKPKGAKFNDIARAALAEIFERHFGIKPSVTVDHYGEYKGPFWDFVRAVSKETKIYLSEGGLKAAPAHVKKRGNTS